MLLTSCRDFELAPNQHSGGISGVASGAAGGGGLGASAGAPQTSGGTLGAGGGEGGRDAAAGDGGGINDAGGVGGVGEGAAGEGGVAGSGASPAGHAGASPEGGAAGGPESEAPCERGQTFGLQPAFAALAASRDPGGAARVYAALPSSNNLAMSAQLDPNDSRWTPWECFDTLPEVKRLAATELSDGSDLVLASTRAGRLFIRSGGGDIASFSSWSPLDLPSPASEVQDVAAVRGAEQRNYLYIVDRGRVFYRYTSTVAADSAYTAWSDLGVSGVQRMSATVLPSLAQIVFVLGVDGSIGYACQGAASAGAAFSAVQPIPLTVPENSVDIESAQQREAGVALWILDDKGAVRTTTLQGPPANAAWAPWITLNAPPDYIPRLTSLGALSGSEITSHRVLFGASEHGQAAYWADFDWREFAIAE